MRQLFGTIVLVCCVAAMVTGAVQAQDPAPMVSLVNGDPVPREVFHARVRLVRWQYLRELEAIYEATGGNLSLRPQYVDFLADNLEDPVMLGDAVLYVLEEERLLWQTGEELGITPTAEDAQYQEAAFFSRWTDVPVDQLATDPEAQAFIEAWYAEATAASGMSPNDIRILFETEALRARLYNYVAESVPREERAANTRHVLCAFHPENVLDTTPPSAEQRAAANTCAETALIRLANGEPFANVAEDLSDDFTSADRGGDVGWQFVSTMLPGYAEAARDAALNTITGPVETTIGMHVIEVLEREMRPLSDEDYAASQRGYFQLWVETLVDEATIERSPDWNAGLPTTPGLDALDAAMLDAIQAVRE